MSTEISEQSLRVLIANERQERLGLITDLLTGLGHTVVAAGVEIDAIGAATRQEHPDVALVALGESSQHALDMITNIVHEAACPVIALLHSSEPDFVNEAAKRGIFAYVTDDDPEQMKATLDIVLRRFAEYHNLEGAFARRAMIEQAKGILMATHAIDDQQAFDMLRDQSQQTGTKLLDLAEAVVHSHRLLAIRRQAPR
ncbi:MAG TPA: ANTAR domain-containing protein [Gaiellaceae bacterium]|nr:ANTAR domain-containing protein [Gaiellaceae bacterium]